MAYPIERLDLIVLLVTGVISSLPATFERIKHCKLPSILDLGFTAPWYNATWRVDLNHLLLSPFGTFSARFTTMHQHSCAAIKTPQEPAYVRLQCCHVRNRQEGYLDHASPIKPHRLAWVISRVSTRSSSPIGMLLTAIFDLHRLFAGAWFATALQFKKYEKQLPTITHGKCEPPLLYFRKITIS